MATNRRFDATAARASAGVDGIIASRNGNATVTPIPFRAVRRDKGLRLINMVMSLTRVRYRDPAVVSTDVTVLDRKAGLFTTPRMNDDIRY